jgi:ATP-binding cassette subfamily F protein uup
MALLLSCNGLSKSYGARPLFEDISLGIQEGERIGLIGPNGAGKSTLMKIFAGDVDPDAGTVAARRNARVAYLPQEDVFPAGATPLSVLEDAMRGQGMDELERQVEIQMLMGQMGFSDPEQPVETLSGGWRKRTAIARELLRKPDLLLLDEPTNHLDLEAILWLEKLLAQASFGFVLISHDRYFLENATTRIIELSRAYPQGYLSVEGKYSDFLVARDEFLAAQATLEATLATQVKREVEWLRRGPQARTTKAQYRIDEAGRMMNQLADVRERNNTDQTARIDFAATGRKTREMLVATDIEKSLGGRTLFSHLSFTLAPGVKLGLLGPNGSGKTSLIKTLTGELEPDSGTIKRADRLRVVLFDQARRQLDLSQSLRTALAGENDTVNFGNSTVHVVSWAKRFLFRSEQLEVPISRLSGGERSRILIAQLMLQPADLLILDEPTNDLDIPSLEILEESLAEFPGAMVLVTHDRYLLDRLSSEILALDGSGGTRFFASLYQWEQAQTPAAPPKPAATGPRKPRSEDNPQRMTRAEQRELERMEEKILAAEEHLATLQGQLNDPAVVSDYKRLQQASDDIAAAEREVAALYARWEELEAKKAAG